MDLQLQKVSFLVFIAIDVAKTEMYDVRKRAVGDFYWFNFSENREKFHICCKMRYRFIKHHRGLKS